MNLKTKKIVTQVVWILIGIGTIVLFGAALQGKNQKLCSDIRIEIVGADEHLFIDEKDIVQAINANATILNQPIATINLRKIEASLENTPWVKNAELYIDNNQILQIKIVERQPIARIFTINGHSFYLDSVGVNLPLSDKLSARVPMFTGFRNNVDSLNAADTVLIKSIVKLGKYIVADSFFMAQTAQIDITPQNNFEIIPTIGNHIITFGTVENMDKKFAKLLSFYKNAWVQNGVDTYEKLDVRFSNQVIGIKKGTDKIVQDSSIIESLLTTIVSKLDIGLKQEKLINTPLPKTAPKDTVATKKKVISTGIKKKLPINIKSNNKVNNNSLSKVDKSISPTIKPKPKAVLKKG